MVFNMNELISVIEKRILSLKSDIERSKNYMDYPFTSNCDHIYRVLLLHNHLETWEQFFKLIIHFKSSRSESFEKQSEFLEVVTKSEIKGIPGFVTKKTLQDMCEYMKQLEWKIEEQSGIWRTIEVNENSIIKGTYL